MTLLENALPQFQIYCIMDSFEVSLLISSFYLDKLKTVNQLDFNLSEKYISSFPIGNTPQAAGMLTITERNLPDSTKTTTFVHQASNRSPVMRNVAGQKRHSPMKTNSSASPKKQNFAMNSSGSVGVKTEAGEASPKKQMFAACVFDGQKMFLCALCSYKTKNNSDMHKHQRGMNKFF